MAKTRYLPMTPEEQEVATKVGAYMKAMRQHRELSQPMLAKRTDISQTTITQIETGKRPPSLRSIIKLANELGYDVSITFTENDKFIKKGED